MSVTSTATEEELDASNRLDLTLVARALQRKVCRISIEQVDVLRRDKQLSALILPRSAHGIYLLLYVDVLEKVLVHKTPIRMWTVQW